MDVGANVTDAQLEQFGVSKGERRVVDAKEAARLIKLLDGDYTIRAGSSLSNSLVALSRLCCEDEEVPGESSYHGAMGGCIGSDVQGDVFRKELAEANIQFLCNPERGTLTGLVIVLTTPDAQRSFVAFPGSTDYQVDMPLQLAISDSRVLFLEGYLMDLPGSLEQFCHAIRTAKESNTLVALTVGDAGLISRQKSMFEQILGLGVDILFANREEALALLGKDEENMSAEDAAVQLGQQCSLAAVTDGSRGSHLVGMGRVLFVPPCWTKDPPVDTCGAGDAYAAGLLHGFLKGLDLVEMGQIATQTASAVISRNGPRLTREEAKTVVNNCAHNRNHGGSVTIKSAQPIIAPRDLIKSG